MGRQVPLETWMPSWARLGAISQLSWVPSKVSEALALRQIPRKPVEQQTLLGLIRCLLGPSWAPGGAPCAPAPGQTRGKLVEHWAPPLKPYWLHAGTLLGRRGAFLGRLAALLGRLGSLEAVLDVHWGTTGALFGCLGVLLGSGGRLGPLGDVLERLLRKLKRTPAPRQTNGKLVEQRAVLGLLGCPPRLS